MWLQILLIFIGGVFDLKVSAVEYRLPEDVVQVNNYNIKLVVTNETFYQTHKFQGTTVVNFNVLKTTKEIQIHGNKLVVSSVTLTKNGATDNIPLEQTNWIFDSDTDILTLTAQTDLQPENTYLLTFEYEADFRTDEMYGFYRSTYIDTDKTEKVLGSTQFQATHARKVFPCFDEPSYKATFDLAITHPKEYSAMSNAEGTSVTSGDNKVTTFATTPFMSTYLLAFVVSEFTCTESVSDKINVVHEVCSRSNTANLRNLAVTVGPELLKVMEDFTDIPYNKSGLGKMRQVAIPDFSAGAMENWGLLTYREANLLWDEEHSSNSYRQSIDNVIAHEIAHMWFGNLVTTHWWSDTFLNEGFARFYQWFAPAKVRTEAKLDLQFVTAILHTALAADSVSTSAALSHNVSSPSAVSGRFSTISYSKGGSVIRMIQHFLGNTNFELGLQKYLKAHMFLNTVPNDLWLALEPTDTSLLPGGLSLATVIQNWILEPGFPVLTVNANGNNITISQKRFLLSGDAEDVKWYVPITYATSLNDFENTTTKAWLLPSENLTISNVLQNSNWVVLNNLQTGFYRINYDDSLWTKIEKVLNSENYNNIHEINRAQLVDDLYNFAKMGDHTFSKVLNFLEYLERERSYFPWNRAITAFSNMLERTGNQNIRQSLSALVARLIKPLYEALPFDEPKNDDQIYTLNRVQASTWACKMGNQDCLDKAKKAFNDYKANNNTKPDKNLRGVIYCNGLRHSNDINSDWDFLWNEYEKSDLATEKVTILSGLGCATDTETLTKYLEKSVNSSSGIKQQDALSVFSAVYSQNPEGVDVALDFLIARYQDISTYYGSLNSLSNAITGIAAKFNKQEQITKLQNFVSTTTLTDTLKATAESAIRSAESNLRWTTDFEKQLTDHFSGSGNTADALKVGLVTTILSFVVTLCILY